MVQRMKIEPSSAARGGISRGPITGLEGRARTLLLINAVRPRQIKVHFGPYFPQVTPDDTAELTEDLKGVADSRHQPWFMASA